MTAALLLIALGTHVVPPHYGRDAPPHTAPLPTAPTPTPTGTLSPSRQVGPGSSHPVSLALPAYILLGLVVAGLLWSFAHLWLSRVRLGHRRRPRPSAAHGDPAAASLTRRIGTAVDEGLDELAHGPVADAIIACWLRLEVAATSAGVTLRRSDTPSETVVRVVAQAQRRPVPPEPLERLAALYREARFSTHTMVEADRDAARSALQAVRVGLEADLSTATAGDHDA